MIWLTLGIIISAIGGLLLSLYIKKNKYSEDHMVCPLGGECKELTSGRFSRFLFFPIETLGALYYGLVIVIYLATLLMVVPDMVLLIGLLLSSIAFAFSMYLTIVQIFAVKKWCTLCLGSTAISFLIIVLIFIGYESTFAEFAYTSRDLLRWIYMIGVILGAVMTTLHARIFINFLKDFNISRKEEKRLEMFSHTAWIGLGLSFLSGLGLVLTDRYSEYVDANSFIVVLIIMGVLIVYEVVVNMYVSPKLIGIHFGEHPELDDHKHGMQRKLAFGFIAVGVVSWYSLLVLSVFDLFSYSSGQLFVTYGILIVLGVAVTMMVEIIIYRKSLRTNYVPIDQEGEE
jgi:uncharacterized membrane protein